MAGSADLIYTGPEGAGTHALVIGIGAYPNLLGGSSPAAKAAGMGQLTSPPLSARSVASWLLADYNFEAKPLASLSLLLSEQKPAPFRNPRTGAGHTVPEATADNIEAAVKAWRKRANGSPDNRLVFYFCGHGISEGTDMALLASDFSPDDEDNPLDQALDFEQLRRGLKGCQASEQVFFVDACRAASNFLISQTDARFAGRVPLLGLRRPPELPRVLSVPYYASLAGERAYGRPGQVSLFTQALLRGLRGAGSDNPEGDWRVSTATLATAIDDFMRRPVLAGRAATVQTPTVHELAVFDLHRLPGDPLVPVYVSCQPAEQNAAAEFVCRQGSEECGRRPRSEVDAEDPFSEWYLELALGDYLFEAEVDGAVPRSLTRAVRPPYSPVRLAAAP
ncbi:caspase family protein [Arthrobacter mangrovi]|uniref:Peptidase C14 caspase domain-containing protein n=1 Tax=Arthrobacter mangrovi TaxID=2966350 RepID=A0ABQ5MW84_9MICC|nr:caspase family protein [Arthrobacter mangrovi]GLB68213.1 hypothetical protein AHIS1636_26550 [Arthrobacter mangrovi]